jgi:hypothetical protein
VTEPWHRTARGAGSSEPDRVAGSHPPRSSGCRARHPRGLIAPGYATCRRSPFRVKTPQVAFSSSLIQAALSFPSATCCRITARPRASRSARHRERQTNTLTSVTRRQAYLAIQTGATRFLAAPKAETQTNVGRRPRHRANSGITPALLVENELGRVGRASRCRHRPRFIRARQPGGRCQRCDRVSAQSVASERRSLERLLQFAMR